MMKKRTYEVKTLEEAQELAIKEMSLSLDELDFEIIARKKGFLGFGAKITVEAKTNVDGVEKGKEYLQTILDANQMKGFIETKVRGNVVNYNLEAYENNGFLIGRNGRNLAAIQTLMTIIVNNYYERSNNMTVIVDIGNYKDRRKRQLEQLAVRVGKQVSQTKQPAKLDNLNSFERRIVHAKLANWKDVKTHSEGEGQDRYLVISPK